MGNRPQDLGAGGRKVFNAIGGTIGRLPDNDWVFPDPYVSGRHALIRYLNGKYFIEDTSTNGVFINSPDNRLSRTQAHQLRDGDVLYIDAYQIKVSIEKDPEAAEARRSVRAAAGAAEQGRRLARFRRRVRRRCAKKIAPPAWSKRPSDADDEDHSEGTEWFGMSEMSSPARSRRCLRARPAAARRHRRKCRAAAPASSGAGGTPCGRLRAQPCRAARIAAARRRRAQLKALLDAAGIEGLDPSSEAARRSARFCASAVGGVMEVLRARERMKDELRMRGTTFKVAHNNPLKFSANVDDAFHNLLVKHNPAYLEPADAFEDAFRDVRDHQAAFLAAMRLAFESMLAQFDPNRLQEEFDRQMKKGSILGVPAKLRYWDLYRDKYGDLAKDARSELPQPVRRRVRQGVRRAAGAAAGHWHRESRQVARGAPGRLRARRHAGRRRHSSGLRLRGVTDAGRVRATNQDAFVRARHARRLGRRRRHGRLSRRRRREPHGVRRAAGSGSADARSKTPSTRFASA